MFKRTHQMLALVMLLLISTIAQAQDTATTSAAAKRLKITLDGKQTVTATLADTPATREFLTHLPVTFSMKEHLSRQKERYLPFKLSEQNLQNPIYEYEVGDIVYWHPGPTMGIFHRHDGRRINAGVERIAKLDGDGAAVFASYPGDVSVTIEVDANAEQAAGNSADSRYLEITLNDSKVVKAVLIESPLTKEFLTKLPITLHMTDYIKREKHAHLPFSISQENLTNIKQAYEIGDVIYYPPGPTFAMYYDHDGRVISAGMEVIAKLDEDGIKTLASYPSAVNVTVKLGK